jgi:hypothetical protein
MAIRLKNGSKSVVITTDANVKAWMPGDIVFDNSIYVPWNFPLGICDVHIAIVDRLKHEPRVNLAIEGKGSDGWYQLGKLSIIK